MISEEIESVQNEADEIEAGWSQSIWPLAMQLRCHFFFCQLLPCLFYVSSIHAMPTIKTHLFGHVVVDICPQGTPCPTRVRVVGGREWSGVQKCVVFEIRKC